MPGRSISQADTLRDELGGELSQFLNREFIPQYVQMQTFLCVVIIQKAEMCVAC